MKPALLFLAGIAVGAVVTWFAFSKSYVLLPSGTTLVEVDRFNGSAREVHYSYEEADRLRREEDQRVLKALEAWEKANTPAPAPATESGPKGEKNKMTPLSAEELALIKFTARINTERSPSRLEYSLYNGTNKIVVQVAFRVEGMRKESSIPIARVVEISTNMKPATDSNGSTSIEYGNIEPSSVDELTYTLTSALAQ
jgi:hypothetical protein